MNDKVTLNDQQEGVDRPDAVDAKPQAPFRWTPEPKYDMTVGADGLPVSTLAKQSPFPLDLIRKWRGNAVIAEQLARGRAEDMMKHRAFMLEEGPRIEKEFSVSAREIFFKGNSGQAQKLHAASRDAYDWLREYSRYL